MAHTPAAVDRTAETQPRSDRSLGLWFARIPSGRIEVSVLNSEAVCRRITTEGRDGLVTSICDHNTAKPAAQGLLDCTPKG